MQPRTFYLASFLAKAGNVSMGLLPLITIGHVFLFILYFESGVFGKRKIG
jgi:hypothetical protein